MKRLVLVPLILINSVIFAQPKSVSSPGGMLKVTVTEDAMYSVMLDGKTILNPSRLGLNTNRGDFSDARMTGAVEGRTVYDYNLNSIKKSSVKKEANTLICTFSDLYKVEFRVSDTDVAFRYIIDNPSWASITILEEKTTFNFPDRTTTFLTPQSDAMVGWQRSKPSYEEHYVLDRPVTEKSEFGHGFTFPCLFKIGEDGWALVCESGTSSQYCGCRLLDWNKDGFQIGFPMPEENDGLGSVEPAFSLPGATPWRTIAVGRTLEPVAESTVTWDDIKFIDGYPGRYAVIAREKDGVWYVAAVNAEQTSYQLDLNSIASKFNSPASVSVLHGDQKMEKFINYKARTKSKTYKSNILSLSEGDGAAIIIQ